jgi:hypothetical protein
MPLKALCAQPTSVPGTLGEWKSCAVLFFGDQSSGAMPASSI